MSGQSGSERGGGAGGGLSRGDEAALTNNSRPAVTCLFNSKQATKPAFSSKCLFTVSDMCVLRLSNEIQNNTTLLDCVLSPSSASGREIFPAVGTQGSEEPGAGDSATL